MVAEKQERQTASVIIKKWGRNRVTYLKMSMKIKKLSFKNQPEEN